MVNTLIIGSCQPFSGKSALILGLARRLKASGKGVRFGKPLATSFEPTLKLASESESESLIDDDVRFVGSILGLTEDQLIPSIHLLASSTADTRLQNAQLDPGNGIHFASDLVDL